MCSGDTANTDSAIDQWSGALLGSLSLEWLDRCSDLVGYYFDRLMQVLLDCRSNYVPWALSLESDRPCLAQPCQLCYLCNPGACEASGDRWRHARPLLKYQILAAMRDQGALRAMYVTPFFVTGSIQLLSKLNL